MSNGIIRDIKAFYYRRGNVEQPQKYKIHIDKRRTITDLVFKLEHTSLTFSTQLEPLRNEFLHLQSLQDELITAVKILLETDVIIVDSQVKADALGESGSIFAKLKEQGSSATAHAWTRLSLSWKIFLYSARCFQDCVYKAILHAQHEPVGPQTSMSTCVSGDAWRNEASVGKLIATRLPDYPNWFIRMRKLRNALKKGLSVQSVWQGQEHFIELCEQRWSDGFTENTKAYALKLEFAIESLKMCMASAELIRVAYDETRMRKEARRRRVAEKEADQ